MDILKESPEGSRLHGCETITMTVSKQFVTDAKKRAQILCYSEDDLGRVIAEYGWTIPDALGDLHSDLEYRTWSNEQECRQVADRVAKRLKADTVVRVGRAGDEWDNEVFPERPSPALPLIARFLLRRLISANFKKAGSHPKKLAARLP